MEKPYRVLAIAEAANPEWVSVPLIGWSLAQALREVADVHLVTQVRNRAAILRAGLVEGQDFTAIDTEGLARPLWKAAEVLRMGKGKGWTTVAAISNLTYAWFEHVLWQRFGADIMAGRYDIVHRITPLSPTSGSIVAARCARAGVPFVAGPMNGGVPWPRGFEAERRREREWLSYVRGAYRMLPGRRRLLESSAALLVGSRHTQGEIPERYRHKCVYLPENAVDPARFPPPAPRVAAPPLRGCFVGRLVPYKGCDMLIEAAAPLLRDGRLTLDVVGDGPAMGDLRALALREGVEGAVTFHGWMAHQAVQTVLAEADVLTFPSIREFGGGVVLEAMAMGVVPVVVDYAGPGEIVTPDVGHKIAVGTRDEIVAGLRARLDEIADAPETLAPMAVAARAAVTERFTWSAKARQVLGVYDWVAGRAPARPATDALFAGSAAAPAAAQARPASA